MRRRGEIVAVGIFAAWIALEAAGLVFLALTWDGPAGDLVDSKTSAPLGVVASGVFAGVGLLLAAKRPRNTIGWIFLGLGLSTGLGLLVPRYAVYAAITHPGSLPGAIVVVAAWQAGWVLLISSIALLLLLFPQGQLQSRRWRFALVLLAVGAMSTIIGLTTAPGPLPKPFASFDNPLGIEVLRTVDRVLFAGFALMGVAMLLGAASLVIRFRRSKGIERHQYRLFTAAAVSFPLCSMTTNLFESTIMGTSALAGAVDVLLNAVTVTAALLLPAATAIAILRYRLYEIDRIISRTLVYGALTLILGAAYVGLVLAGQALFSSFAGGSNLAIAASTLVVAALFLPVRARVQRFVDRRFYRSRYDAQRTLEAFGGRLREQVELERLATELHGVVSETMQPKHVSLWLRRNR